MGTVETCKAQLLYKIQGPWYFNSDATAVLDSVLFESIGTNRVAIQSVEHGRVNHQSQRNSFTGLPSRRALVFCWSKHRIEGRNDR
jgi:hypothetical protein